MPTLYILRGLPASGKTTLAMRMVKEDGVKRVNRDDLRAMIDGGEYNPIYEKLIVMVENTVVWIALMSQNDVVVDDTNLKPQRVNELTFIAGMCGATTKVIELNTPVEECVRRDASREKPVGASVIRQMHEYQQEIEKKQEN